MRAQTSLPAVVLLTAGAVLGWISVSAQERAAPKPPAGFPAADEVQKAYDEADLNRAVQAYKFFYPTVAFSTGYANLRALGILET